jgi:SAM-dependent MidA family methyltransferase
MYAPLPAPDPVAAEHSARLLTHIRDAIERAGGSVDFAHYMALALYAPGLGYYAAGATKLGPSGDFVTAPELSPAFGQAIAAQLAPLVRSGLPAILEAGPGRAALAASILEELGQLDALPHRYLLLEPSPDLRERGRALLAERIPALAGRTQWIDALPQAFEGVVLGNEVLDAMPARIVGRHDGVLLERRVGIDDATGRPCWRAMPLGVDLLASVQALQLPDDVWTEIHVEACAFIRTIAAMLRRGVALFIDYGFPAREYYHPQRRLGTLMCHYRHRAHDDPFFLPGLQDITVHVDFTAVAQAAMDAGLDLLGYTSQAQFLINAGITDILLRRSPVDAKAYLPEANRVQRLLSPNEMGELIKVIALGRGIDAPLKGFDRGDRSRALA